MKTLSDRLTNEQIGYQMEKQAFAFLPWAGNLATTVAPRAAPWIADKARGLWGGIKGLFGGGAGAAAKENAVKTLTAGGGALNKGSMGRRAADWAKNHKGDLFMWGGLGAGIPLGLEYGIQRPAREAHEANLKNITDQGLAAARYNYMQGQQAKQKAMGGLGGAALGGTLGNLLSGSLGLNKSLGTVLGGAAGTYLGSQYGPGAYNYLSNKWGG